MIKKPKKNKTSNKFSIKKFTTYFILILFLSLISTLLAYIFIENQNTKSHKYEEKTKALNIEYKSKTIQEKVSLPKLAIIVDDVSFQAHINKINEIDYPVTMAFLPPTARHKNSAKIAQGMEFYMIHFPLEARSFKFAEDNTLKTSDSYETILNRVSQLKSLYPKATYTNNHTGSKFTSNEEAMDKFMRALKEHNMIFVDSRTTAQSVAEKFALKYDVPFLSRNIFLDNKPEKDYIQKQLIKAVNIAKEHGQAIAICHPHKITLQTLKESKHLLKDVQLVLVNEL